MGRLGARFLTALCVYGSGAAFLEPLRPLWLWPNLVFCTALSVASAAVLLKMQGEGRAARRARPVAPLSSGRGHDSKRTAPTPG